MEQFTRVPNRVLVDPDLSAVAKVVYAVLASHVSNGGTTCWPSWSKVATEANVSRRTVSNALSELREHGILTWTTRKRDDSLENTSNLYCLPLQGDLGSAPDALGGASLALGGAGDAPGVVQEVHRGSAPDALELEEVNKTKLNQTKELDASAFDEFWASYPRRAGKATAKKAFIKACKRAGPEQIVSGAHALAQDPNLPEPRYIPHPTTWLNRDGWEDEPQPERNATTDRQALILRAEMARAIEADSMNANPFQIEG